MKRKKKKLAAEFWKHDAENRKLLDKRIAYHKAKLEQERPKS
jgi:hypothetical protein